MKPWQTAASELILIVDDDAELRDAMRMLLELGGYSVETACDGTQALDGLRSGLQPRLILLDLMMPGMDSFQFVNEKRQDPQLCRIPVIIYSGHYDARANAQAGSDGVTLRSRSMSIHL